MWFKWLLIILWVMESVGVVARIGDSRTHVYTKDYAIATIFINVLLIAGMLYFWQ